GKSVTSLFLRSILEATGARFGLVSTLGWSDGETVHPAGRTPPEAESLAMMLAAMVDCGCEGGIVQIRDESLARRTIEGIRFDTAVVTGLSGLRPIEADSVVVSRR